MGKKTAKAESSEGNGHPEESNDLQSKIVNKDESDVDKNNTDGSSFLNINVDEKGNCNENAAAIAAETSGYSTRLRRRSRSVSYRLRTPSPESQPNSSKKIKTKKASTLENKCNTEGDGTEDLSNIKTQGTDNCDNENDTKKSFSSTSLALDKLKFDIKVDPNAEDRYVDSGFPDEEAIPESPETRRQRIDIISRQCRLHPLNKKYNQGPVENPPLITPGKMVGFTPGGQRHEVDLNFERPTWFNSEYARMQWDCATTVNVSRMFDQLQTGTFLPDGLDPNIERRYFAEQEMAIKQATEVFQISNASTSCVSGQPTSSPDLTDEDNEHLRLLGAENELIELHQFLVVRLLDFGQEVIVRLQKALDLPLTPLMIKKNPLIPVTLEVLTTECTISSNVKRAAQALFDKIKGLFQVPINQEFRDHFATEVAKLREKTKDMSGYDILMMTEEPPDESDSNNAGDRTPTPPPLPEYSFSPDYMPRRRVDLDDSESVVSTVPVSSHFEEEQDLGELEDWVPIVNGDIWVDSMTPVYEPIEDGYEYNSTDSLWDSSVETDDDQSSSDQSDLEDEFGVLAALISEE